MVEKEEIVNGKKVYTEVVEEVHLIPLLNHTRHNHTLFRVPYQESHLGGESRYYAIGG